MKADETGPPATTGDFAAALRTRRDLVYRYLEEWPGGESFRPAAIHDGLFSYVRHRGKGLRPALLLLSCGAAGGDEEVALPAAAAVEIFHIWTLVHDDIIDRDDTRRGHPTVHALYRQLARDEHGVAANEADHYGTTVAILAGDLQQSWSFSLLCDLADRGVRPEVVLAVIRRMSSMLTPRLLEGEMLDVQYALAPPEQLTARDVLHMIECKTAALLEFAAWAGATVGLNGAPDPDDIAEKLGRFAALCGIAFQVQDDVLGLTADTSELGKPVGSDLREGKRTLIVLRALAALSDSERNQLLRVLGNHAAAPAEIDTAMASIRRSRALEGVADLANEYISQALALLATLPQREHVRMLGEWASFMLARRS